MNKDKRHSDVALFLKIVIAFLYGLMKVIKESDDMDNKKPKRIGC